MANNLIRPNWYREDFYDKHRTSEEWLHELYKRDQFNRDEIGLPHSIYLLPIKEQEKHFIQFIFNQKIETFLNHLKATPPKPIRYPSVSDLFRMYHLFTNSDWYKSYAKRDVFENAMSTINNEGALTKEQKIAFLEMYDTPWCVFHENHQQNDWYPNKEWAYLSGIPLSLDPSYAKEDTVKVLKMKLTKWVGKLQDIQLQFISWQESKILAVFDLMLWFRMQRIEYSNIDLHKIIWPKGRVSNITGEQVNPYDDIDHSIRLANRVIDKSQIRSLLMLCEAKRFKKEMIDA